MFLDKKMWNIGIQWMPELKEYLRPDGNLTVRVDKTTCGSIQSVMLWYNDLMRHLQKHGLRKCMPDKCVLLNCMDNGKYIMLLLYVDNILVLAESSTDRNWLSIPLKAEYDKVTSTKQERLPYLIMTIIKKENGFEVCMKLYIEDMLKLTRSVKSL
jgi:hypothetical protein